MERAGLGTHLTPCGIPELEKLAAALPDYRIRVVSNENRMNIIFDRGPKNAPTIDLLLENKHYNLITSMPAVFNTRYFCDTCNKPYNNKDSHVQCYANCPMCFEKGRCEITDKITCDDCNRTFANMQCHTNHLRSICKIRQRCLKCGVVVAKRRGEPHVCEKSKCPSCLKMVDRPSHQCFVSRPKEEKRSDDPQSFIFFDFECSQVDFEFKCVVLKKIMHINCTF